MVATPPPPYRRPDATASRVALYIPHAPGRSNGRPHVHLYLYMYVYIHVLIYVHIHLHGNRYVHLSTAAAVTDAFNNNNCQLVRSLARVYVYEHTNRHCYTWTWTYIYIYMYIYIYTYIYMYTQYTWTYIYIRTCMCMRVYVFIFSAVIHPSEFHRNIFTICFIHAGIRPRSLIRPPRQRDYRTRSVCVRARDACDPKPLFDRWILGLAIHGCSNSTIACDPCVLARQGVAQTHSMRKDLATVKAIAGDSSFSNRTIRSAGSVYAGKSRRRGYDSGQPFLINHTILPAKGACRQNQARPAVSNPSPHTEHDSPQHSDD